MNSLGYLIAALLLAIYGGRLIADARKAAGTWAGLAKSAGGFLATNNGWLKIAAAFLAGVVCCYVVSHGVSLPNIDWPVVVKPDVVDGPRRILIAYESTNSPAAFKGTLVSLRTGTAEAALKARGHTLDIIDLDEKDKDGNPSKASKDYRAAYPSLQVPVIILRDQAGKVLHSEPLATSAKLADVLAIVEAKR